MNINTIYQFNLKKKNTIYQFWQGLKLYQYLAPQEQVPVYFNSCVLNKVSHIFSFFFFFFLVASRWLISKRTHIFMYDSKKYLNFLLIFKLCYI